MNPSVRAAIAWLAFPACALLLAALVGQEPVATVETDAAPRSVAVERLTLACPGTSDPALAVHGDWSAQIRGEVDVRDAVVGSSTQPVTVTADGDRRPLDGAGPSRVADGGDAVLADVLGPSADRVVLGRPGAGTAVECAPTLREQWFTGVGAGARYSSVVELVNPGIGTAVVDLTLFGRTGALDLPDLLGVGVAPGESIRLDLGSIAPRREELTLRAEVIRGRAATFVRSRVDLFDGSEPSEDWVPAQAAPAERTVILGAYTGEGQRTLVVANPGEEAATVSIRLLGRQAEFEPTGAPAVTVPAGGVQRVDLGPLLAGSTEEVLGVAVESDVPVTTSFRALVNEDLVIGAPNEAVTAAALPTLRGPKQILMSNPGPEPIRFVLAGLDDSGRIVFARSRPMAVGASTVEEIPGRVTSVRVGSEQGVVMATLVAQQGGGTSIQRARQVPDAVEVPTLRRAP